MTEDAASVAKALQGVRNGSGWLCRCPVPSHGQGKGDKNPSLSVADGESRLLLKCFAGCDPRDILDALRKRGMIEDKRGAARRQFGDKHRAGRLAALADHKPDPEALALWNQSSPCAGTLAEIYLRSRGLILDPPASLRFLANVSGMPAMVAAVQAPDSSIVACQLTYLDPSGRQKAAVAVQRRTIGALGDGAVRLADAGEELGVAEGTEDARAATQLTGIPTWACLGAGRMHRVEIPATVRTLHVFADDDPPGRAAAERTAKRHAALGRRVIIRRPQEGIKDWGDYARRLIERAAA